MVTGKCCQLLVIVVMVTDESCYGYWLLSSWLLVSVVMVAGERCHGYW